MFVKNSVIMNDYVSPNMNNCINNENYFDNISIRDICYEKDLIDHKYKSEAHTLSINRDLEEPSPYLKLNSMDMYNGRRSGIYERSRKNRFDDETFMDILNKNGVKFDSKNELTRVLTKIRNKYSWSIGFSLQLGSKGRKIMLQLLRLAYRSNKKNKNIFQSKNPPTTISNLPFFKISMLWELANDMGVFEHAILIHELFGSFKKKLITHENTNFYYPDAPSEKYKFKNNLYCKIKNKNNNYLARRLNENTEVEAKHNELNNTAYCMQQSNEYMKMREQMCQEDSINLINSIINDVVLTPDEKTLNPPYGSKTVGLINPMNHQFSLLSPEDSSNMIKLKGNLKNNNNNSLAFETYSTGLTTNNPNINPDSLTYKPNDLNTQMAYANTPQNFIFSDSKFRGSPSSVSTCVSSYMEDAINNKLLHTNCSFDICSPNRGSYSDLSDLNGYITIDNELSNYDNICLDAMVNPVDQIESEALDSFASYLNAE